MEELPSPVLKGSDMSFELFMLMVGAYLVMVAISAFAGYGDGERGNDGSKHLPVVCVFSSAMGMGIALAVLILEANIAEKTFGLEIAFWVGGAFIAACMSTWARKAGYAEYRTKHPYLS